MAASPFSFHCMICFEEFDPEERFPVVLPCGHTYVCHVCAQRLDKCMECRTPLTTWTASPPPPPMKRNHAPTAAASRWSSTSSRTAAAAMLADAKKQPPTKTRLPLPKNVVLLSLMEATELATERSKPESPIPSKKTQDEEDEEPSLEEEHVKIQQGTLLAVSECGTYVVTSRQGLAIFPSRPSSENFGQEEDIDTLVRFFHLDTKKSVGQLSYGDRLQIVSVEKKWAKLARGYGFVHANENQVVKVGGSMDRACRLEAMLHSLSIRRKQLRREQSKVDSRFVVLMKELQTSLLTDEDLTVICAETFIKEPPSTPPPSDDSDDNHQESFKENEADLSKPIEFKRQETPQALIQQSSSTCGGFSFPEIAASLSVDPFSPSTPQQETSPRNNQRMLAGARAWRERNSQDGGIDFRTGLSGHMALFSTHAHPHDYLQKEQLGQKQQRGQHNRGAQTNTNRGMMLGMSNHTGLSMHKSVKKAPSFPPDG